MIFSLGDWKRFLDSGRRGKDWTEAAQLVVVVEAVLLVVRGWLAAHILPAHMLDNVAHIVVFVLGKLATLPNHNFVAAPAEVLFVVNQEVSASLQP